MSKFGEQAVDMLELVIAVAVLLGVVRIAYAAYAKRRTEEERNIREYGERARKEFVKGTKHDH